jgi:hypothetical protein
VQRKIIASAPSRPTHEARRPTPAGGLARKGRRIEFLLFLRDDAHRTMKKLRLLACLAAAVLLGASVFEVTVDDSGHITNDRGGRRLALWA